MPAITTPQSVVLIKFFVPQSPCTCLLSSQATVAVLCTALMARHFEARDLERATNPCELIAVKAVEGGQDLIASNFSGDFIFNIGFTWLLSFRVPIYLK